MQVQLKNGVFTATQWFKDGDHRLVKRHSSKHYVKEWYGIYVSRADDMIEIFPGTWIVEMFDGIHLFSDEEFRKLFEPDTTETVITNEKIAHIIDLLERIYSWCQSRGF